MAGQNANAEQPTPVQEGARWRHARPTAEELTNWWGTVPLDEDMEADRAKILPGLVLIPAKEKVDRIRPDGSGSDERWEQTFTPYVRVDTRVSYFRQLATKRKAVAVIEPVQVPRTDNAAFFNGQMADGFWWHVMGESQGAQRFLCATWRVALYDERTYRASDKQLKKLGERRVPLLEGIGTKQVADLPGRNNTRDTNALAKAETGAIGRALGVAGILIVGTGIATAEDMQELLREPQLEPVALPAPGAGEETEGQLNERLGALEARLRAYGDAWREFANWWAERAKASGWKHVNDAPVEARRGVATKMEAMLAELPPEPPAAEVAASPADSSPAEEGGDRG